MSSIEVHTCKHVYHKSKIIFLNYNYCINYENYNYYLSSQLFVSFSTGAGLVMEGFMSAFYHICPSNSNFQFGEPYSFC